MTQYDISVISKPSVLVNSTTSTYTELAETGSITLLDILLAVDNSSLKTETSFIVDGIGAPTNPTPIVSAESTVTFTGTVSSIGGKFLGFRLVSAAASTDFSFSTSSSLFTGTDSKTISAAGSDTTDTVIWTNTALSDPLTTLDPLPILIKCASTDFTTITTNPLTYTIEIYVADAITPTISNLLKLGEVSQTSTSVDLTVSAVKGDVDTAITSYDPTVLSTLKTSFSSGNEIAIKAVITKADISKELTNIEFAIAIPSLAVDYSGGNIYISKADNTTSIADFGTTIASTDFYTTTLAASSDGISLTTDSANGIITVTLGSLPATESAKFIDGTTGVVSPLYVFVIGTVQ